MAPDVVIDDDIEPADLDFLEERINAYNFATTGLHDGRSLSILMRDAHGRIVAGLAGHTWGGACEVRFLWVEQARRRSGLGGRMLRGAEDEARRRGCRKIFLSTHSFQAPDFYRRHGYAVVGEFSDYPRGHSQFFLEKPLPEAAPTR